MSAQVDLDQVVRAACDAGDFRGAATHALETHARELRSFLKMSTHFRSDADEVYAMLAEDIWRGLPNFEFRCSVRVWLYTLARNAARRFQLAQGARRRRSAGSGGRRWLPNVAVRARSSTNIYLRTEAKTKVRALRDRLRPEDRALLVLHIDRGLRWRELAIVMHQGGTQLEGEELARATVTMRKRFERVKQELRRMAIEEGLLKISHSI
jgi:RNA polymerase sigma-70 factor (ECF subfamily)